VTPSAVQTVRDAYAALNARDLDSLLGHLDPWVELRMPLDPLRVHPLFSGHEGVRGYFAVLFGAFPEYSAELEALQPLGAGVVVAVGRWHLRDRDGTQRLVRFSHFWEVAGRRVRRISLHDAENPLTAVDSGRALSAAA
jgi:ketosteroid isomerase-like protein